MTDLESRLRADAHRIPTSARSDLADRIVASLPTAGPLHADHHPRWPLALAAGLAAAVVLGFLARERTPAPADTIVVDVQPQITPSERLVLPTLDWPTAWRLDLGKPLSNELALIEAELTGVGRFLADRLPTLGTREVN